MGREPRQPNPSFRPNRDEGDPERIHFSGITDPNVQLEGEQGRILTTVEHVSAGNFLVILDKKLDPAQIGKDRAEIEGIVQNLDQAAFVRGGSFVAIANDEPMEQRHQAQPTLGVVQVVNLDLAGGHVTTGCTAFRTPDRTRTVELSKDRRVVVLGPGDRSDPFPTLPELGEKELAWLNLSDHQVSE